MPPANSQAVGGAPRFRRPRLFTTDFVIKIVSLVFAVGVVWWIYEVYVNPEVARMTAESRFMMQQDPNYVAPRSLAIIVKDWEQRFEIIFWIWATILLGLKLWQVGQENKMLGLDYLRLEPGERILPDDALGHYQDLRAAQESRPSWRDRVVPNVILAALHRFHTTHSIMDASQAIKERSEVAGSEIEADLSLIRYIAWAIPAIGFIGTVRGIGEALSQAQRAISGDISGVIDALGLAFNSTLVALLLSIPLMFVLHLLQGRQDKLVLDIQNFSEEHVVGRMKVPGQETGAATYQV